MKEYAAIVGFFAGLAWGFCLGRVWLAVLIESAAPRALPAVNSASRQADHGTVAGAETEPRRLGVLLTHPREPVRDSAKYPAVAAPVVDLAKWRRT